MAKRHFMQSGNWVSVVRRLEELVLANFGGDPFEQIFKLLIAKLVAETLPECQYEFRSREDASATRDQINGLLGCATKEWSDLFNGDEPRMELSSEHLDVCVRALAGHDIANAKLEVFDSIFESLATSASKGSKGQYFTPRHVVECGVRIVNPQPGETLVDPACGSGGFLVHALDHMRRASDGAATARTNDPARNIWGFDFDARARRIAKALLVLSGGEPDNIFGLNSLRTPDSNLTLFDNGGLARSQISPTIEDVVRTRFRNFEGFDVLLTNPPFAGEVREESLLEPYELNQESRRTERDILFLERCVSLLRPGGRFGIVLPDNKVGSPHWGFVRSWLLKHVRVVTVLGLGRETFQPHTHQKTSFLFGIKRPDVGQPDLSEEILFLISEQSGKDSTGELVERDRADPSESAWNRADHDLHEAVEQVRTFTEKSVPNWGVGK